MHFLNKIFFLLFAVLISICQNTSAQSLNGKKIFVSPAQIVLLKFGSTIKNYEIDKETRSIFNARPLSDRILSITSTGGNFKPSSLVIIEGRNTHLFIIEYKESLDFSETSYDFSRPPILREEVEKLRVAAAKEDSMRQSNRTPPIVPDTTSLVKPKLTPKEMEEKYAELVLKANTLYNNKKFAEAKVEYAAALDYKPNDEWCVYQIKSVDNMVNLKEKEDLVKISIASYNNHRRIGDSAFNAKSYQIAKFEYTQALREKPNDVYCEDKIKKIELAIKNDSYQSFMNIGYDDLANQFYDKATLAFTKALEIKPKDPEALKGLAKVGSVQKSDQQKQSVAKSAADKLSRYNDTVAMADNLYQVGMYDVAKKKYVTASLMQPTEAYPKKQIKAIDSIQLKHKDNNNKLKQDSLNTISYNSAIEKADKAFEAKDYKRAKTNYLVAQSLKPQEKYPALKLSEIEILIGRMDADKIAEAARKAETDSINKQYNLFLKRAAAATSANDYTTAKDFLTKALEKKPGEKVPTDQLIFVNKKLLEISNNEKYDFYLHLGDSAAFRTSDYKTALKWYDSASALKPDERWPKNRIITVNMMMMKKDSLRQASINTTERNVRYNEGIDSYNKGEAFRLQGQGKYADAYKAYAAFLAKIDMASFDKYDSKQQHNIKWAQEMLTDRMKNFKPDPIADSLRNAHIQDSLSKPKTPPRRRRGG